MWATESTWWQVYPLGSVGAPIRDTDDTPGSHRLRRLLPWVHYAADLGVSGLLLGPVFASTSHGYDTLDHYRIDPRLGDGTDLADLIATASTRGLRVVLDGVFNHVGSEHPAYRDVLREGPGHPDAALFAIDWSDPRDPRPGVFEGHPGLVELDHSSRRTRDYVVDVMTYWLDRGVAGWRLDAAYAVPLEFWRDVLPAVRARHREAWFLGEVIHGDYPSIVDLSTMDTVTQYRLWKAVWSSLKDDNFYELDWTLREHSDDFLRYFVPQTFVGNHDVTRIATQVGRAKAGLAAVVLLTVPGIPSIYYGDERGYEAVKEERLGGDDAIRPALPASPADLDDDGAAMFRLHSALLAVRRERPWVATSRIATLHLDNRRYVYRAYDPGGAGEIDVELWTDDGVGARITEGGDTILAYDAATDGA
ncbi:alpha-amylase family protein [Propionicicella superfundia]|uniref:alpha-amylase family protein n=1 Tax=Propionicicella superfundia TaxID=348582 RepID=UPI0004102B5D|nr:alpha-amylase family protein [Propionicicella superfundia]